MKHVLMIISGPSGAGKGTIVKTIIARREDVVESVSCTTRQPRAGEVDGKHYFFISREEFEKRIQENGFLEYDEHFGNIYGTPRSFVEETLKTKSIILEIDVEGGLEVKKSYPDCVLVMVVPPSLEELKRRLEGRNSESKDEIENRLSRIEYEYSKKELYDYVVVNDDLETAIREVEGIIDNPPCKK